MRLLGQQALEPVLQAVRDLCTRRQGWRALLELGVHDQAPLWYERALTATPTQDGPSSNLFLDAEEINLHEELDAFREQAREMFAGSGM